MCQPEKFCAAYIDDILIHSTSFDSHLEHLVQVFQCLQDDSLHVSLEKSVLFRTSVACLGHCLSEKVVAPDPVKLAVLKEFEIPTTLSQLWKFVGAVNWFRTFIPHLSTYSQPLQTCITTSTNQHLAWNEDCTAAFNNMKKILTEFTEQAIFDPNLLTFLWTDASDVGIGSVLLQQDPSTGQWQTCLFLQQSSAWS